MSGLFAWPVFAFGSSFFWMLCEPWQLLQDGADANHLKASSSKVSAAQSLTLKLAPSGGAVAVIKP